VPYSPEKVDEIVDKSDPQELRDEGNFTADTTIGFSGEFPKTIPEAIVKVKIYFGYFTNISQIIRFLKLGEDSEINTIYLTNTYGGHLRLLKFVCCIILIFIHRLLININLLNTLINSFNIIPKIFQAPVAVFKDSIEYVLVKLQELNSNLKFLVAKQPSDCLEYCVNLPLDQLFRLILYGTNKLITISDEKATGGYGSKTLEEGMQIINSFANNEPDADQSTVDTIAPKSVVASEENTVKSEISENKLIEAHGDKENPPTGTPGAYYKDKLSIGYLHNTDEKKAAAGKVHEPSAIH